MQVPLPADHSQTKKSKLLPDPPVTELSDGQNVKSPRPRPASSQPGRLHTLSSCNLQGLEDGMGNAAAVLPEESFKHATSALTSWPPSRSMPPVAQRILFVTSELTDLVKVGGLGDVSAALPRALSRHHDVRVLLPGYRQVMRSGLPMRVIGKPPGRGAIPPCLIGELTLPDQLVVHVVLCQQLY